MIAWRQTEQSRVRLCDSNPSPVRLGRSTLDSVVADSVVCASCWTKLAREGNTDWFAHLSTYEYGSIQVRRHSTRLAGSLVATRPKIQPRLRRHIYVSHAVLFVFLFLLSISLSVLLILKLYHSGTFEPIRLTLYL